MDPRSAGSSLVHSLDHTLVLETASRRIQGGKLYRNLTTATTTSTSVLPSEMESETGSTLHRESTSTSTISESTSPSPSKTSTPASADSESLDQTTSDFRALFSKDAPARPRGNTPWRKNYMNQGSELEESLRKAVYDREPIGNWWPMYEQVAESRQWNLRGLLLAQGLPPAEDSVFCTMDFLRFIGSLKVSTQPSEGRLFKLERLFEDYHCALGLPSSNVKVYTALLDTLTFWKQQDLVPQWIGRFKFKIMAPPATGMADALLTHRLLIPERAQEQYQNLMRVLGNTAQIEPILECLQELKSSQTRFLKPTTHTYDSILQAHLRRKDTTSAMSVFQEMQEQPGCEPQISTYNILLKGHLDNKDALSAQRVLETLLLSEHRPNIDTFNLLMSGYLQVGEFELVNGFYKGLDEYGLTPDAKTFRILMRSHQQQGQVDQVLNLFRKLMESPREELHPGPEAYRVLIQTLATNERMVDALKVLRELTESRRFLIPISIYQVFLVQYAREGQAEKARRVLETIIREKLAISGGTINPLIQVYLSSRDYAEVREMTDLMHSHGIRPTDVTFHIMMNSAKYSGNLEGAMQLYSRMLSEGVEPDAWTYNTLLDVIISKLTPRCGNARWKGDGRAVTAEQIQEYVPKIETLLVEMRTRGIRPDVVTFGKLIHQYVVLRDIEQAEMVFHEMIKSGIKPNAVAFNTLMDGFTVIGEMDKAIELFRKMTKYGVEPDATTFTTLIKGYTNLNRIKAAQDFANSMQQFHGSKFRMDRYGLHTLMQLAQKSSQPYMTLDFFEIMRSRGLEPDSVTYTILANALSRELAESNRRRKSLANNGRRRRGGAAAEQSSSHDAQVLESVLDIIQRKAEGQSLNQADITTMLSAYFRLGRPVAAIDFFRSTLRGAKEPRLSTASCGALLSGLLAPELGRRYDGSVLNLYAKMLTVTRTNLVAAATAHTPPAAASSLSSPPSFGNPSDGSPISSSTANLSSMQGLPGLDIVTINILFQAFSKRKNWALVLQFWKDFESIGAENMYPFEMPLEFWGFAAEAYHRTATDRWKEEDLQKQLTPPEALMRQQNGLRAKENTKKAAKRRLRLLKALAEEEDTTNSTGEVSHEIKARQLLTKLWTVHPSMGQKWSTRIYGFNIFEGQARAAVPSTNSTSSSSSSSSNSSSTSTSTSHQSAALSSYLSGLEERQQQHQNH
ncbi:hypothetical protein BGZ83_009858 [Gryganskiella cystojenkinii]|nr:hypothetical protein BGZ83_009858 [Gryganskiella cystojenkinii]